MATGNDPLAITLNDAGTVAYIVNGVDSTVAAYRVDSSTGLLTAVSSAATGLLPRAFAIVAVP
jgi:6-phosphogluconolactonase (cycloisomerase 2 family)